MSWLYGNKQERVREESEHDYLPPKDIEAACTSGAPGVHSGEIASWCPGCGHGSLSLMLATAIDDLGIQDKVVLSVGCGSTVPQQLNVHSVATPHGCASDVATGLSRMLPDRVVVQYSGDGDAYAIGLSGLLHACNRQENFLVFVYNNKVYGMTGDQIGPTTSPAVPTTTFQQRRPEEVVGHAMDIMNMLQHMPGVAYAARCSTSFSKRLLSARKIIRKAFQIHLDGVKGMKVVDVMGNCNVNWKGGGLVVYNRMVLEAIMALPMDKYRLS